MANYITDPILAAIGIVDGVLEKTKEWIGTARGGAVSDEANTQGDNAEA